MEDVVVRVGAVYLPAKELGVEFWVSVVKATQELQPQQRDKVERNHAEIE